MSEEVLTKILTDPAFNGNIDIDIDETREWLEALEGIIDFQGPDRTKFLLQRLVEKILCSWGQILLLVLID